MTKKTIFITGAASGIGRATARHFAQQGWFVGLYDIDETGLISLADELGEQNCTYQRLDLRDEGNIQQAIHHFSENTSGKMNVLFNCAGVMTVGAFEEMDSPAFASMMSINNGGMVYGTKSAFDMLKNTPGSRVINMCSASAVYGVPDFAVYSATKFFVRGWTEALHLEWVRHDIHVCDVLPPFVNTPLLTDQKEKPDSVDRMGVHLEPADVAKVVWRAATGRKRVHWPVYWQFKFMYAIGGFLPGFVQRWVMRRVSGY